MRPLAIFLISSSLLACAGKPARVEPGREPAKLQAAYDLVQLQSALGMDRSPRDLGLNEKAFDSCRTRIKESGERCGTRYFSVLNFKLACRDSEGTVDTVVTNVKPLVSESVQYQLAGQRGTLQSDREGYVQLRTVTSAPVRGSRLVITVGRQFFGKDVGEVDQVVLPNYWCD